MRREPDEGWFVHVREWPGCMSQADTAADALANIREVIPLWLEGALESDYEIPEPPTPVLMFRRVPGWRPDGRLIA